MHDIKIYLENNCINEILNGTCIFDSITTVATLEERWKVLPPYERLLNSEVSVNEEVSFCRNILSQNVSYRIRYVSSFIYILCPFDIPTEPHPNRRSRTSIDPVIISNYIKLLLIIIIIQSINY